MKPLVNILSLVLFTVVLASCSSEEPVNNEDCITNEFYCNDDPRNFKMGFSTWPYAATIASVESTYQFIGDHSDIYSEHIDAQIPWNAWINDLSLPDAFTSDISSRASRKISDKTLTVSVSLLNSERSELAFDYDGSIPAYAELNDKQIEDAYFKHLSYITDRLNPEYLVVSIEGNELLNNSPEKWEGYKLLMANIRTRIHQEYPTVKISESITLHNFYQPDVSDPDTYIQELANYANSLDFVAISFYPFFKGQQSKADFQKAFDFLHEHVNQPIAFAETSHLSEDLVVESYSLSIPGNPSEQNEYLQTLVKNAHENDYKYVIWWAHRDYDALWETFPAEAKDLGKLWLSTGLVEESGTPKEAFATWEFVFNK